MARPEPFVSRPRHASQLLQIRSQYLHPGDYRPFKRVIQDYTVTQAHPDEPYIQKYVKFMETRFHELEHESKMRLLKTHSHTSGWRGYEADKERQVKVKERRPLGKRQETCQRKTPLYHLERGDGARTCRRKR